MTRGEHAVRSRISDRLTGVLAGLVLSLVAILSALVLACVGVHIVPAGTNLFTLAGTMVWAAIGPHLVIASALLFLVALRGAQVHRLMGIGAALLALGALVASSVIVASIVLATHHAGGSANPFTALVLGSDGRGPDAVETYATAGKQDLRAFIYTAPSGGTNAPVIVYIHGGGWIGGGAEWGADARWFADQGWLVISVEYRLATASGPTWNQAPADVGCALAWVARNAVHWRGDASRLAVLGDSAGGNLAVNLGWSAANGRAPSSCDREVPPPAAVVVQYPVVNPSYTYAHGREWLFQQRPQDFTRTYLGGSPDDHPERLAAISAVTHLSAAVPATLIIQPERDDFIPAQGVHEVVDRARASGADVMLVSIPFTHHAYDQAVGSIGNQVRRSITRAWLQRRGLAP
jgi:acetyl esterase